LLKKREKSNLGEKKIIEFPDPAIEFDLKNVYSPSDDTYLIIDYFKAQINFDCFDGIPIENINKILDLGTGTGIIAIFFYLIKNMIPKFNPKIFASDIIKEAIDLAKYNEKLNKIEKKIEFILSDLFKEFPESLKHSFNIIVFNPPYLPSSRLIKENKTKLKIDHSWDGGKKGSEVFLRFLDEVKYFMKQNNHSRIYYISSSRINLKELNKQINNKGFKRILLGKKHIFFENIYLNRLEIEKF